MRQVHRAGERTFVDYSGKKPHIVDPHTGEAIEVESRPIREQGYRSARGLQRVGDKYGPERTEAACARALSFGTRSYKPVEQILRLGRDTTPVDDDVDPNASRIAHENVRGPDYYH